MNNSLIVPILIVILLNACTQPLNVKNNASTVVLLKNKKAHNAIIFSTKNTQQELNTTREFIDVTTNKVSKPNIMSKKELKRRFGDLLAMQTSEVKSYILFFKENTMELTSSSQKHIDEIIQIIISQSPSVTDIIGHTDTVGSEANNIKASLKQALYVESIFKEKILKALTGIKQITLKVKGYGELDLLVPTQNDAYEPKNKNVEIFIK